MDKPLNNLTVKCPNGHFMIYTNIFFPPYQESVGWFCDVCNKNANDNRHHCKQCRYDLCDDCT
jgi:hypothetical protein